MSLHVGERRLGIDDRAPRLDDRAPRFDDCAPRLENRAPRLENHAPRLENRAPRLENHAPRLENHRQPLNSAVSSLHLIKLACELPDAAGRSLSLWTCAELARALIRDGIVATLSPQSMQRILYSKRLKPWRVHSRLSPKTPRDEEFRARIANICDLYTRPLMPHERVLCLDEIPPWRDYRWVMDSARNAQSRDERCLARCRARSEA